MKKITSVFLAILIMISVIPAVFSAGNSVNLHGKQVVPSTNVYGFEESCDGYETSFVIYDGKMVRSIYRTGADETKNGFNMYNWNCIRDENGDYIRLETTKYIVVEYYYHSPDANPALAGNRMRWEQGRIVAADNISKVLGFAWDIKVPSTEMVANKWDTLVISLEGNDTIKKLLEKYRAKGSHYVHQFKFYPLERDMGKNDVLYIGDITFQSFDPREKMPEEAHDLTFESIDKDQNKVVRTKDFEKITMPEYHLTLPGNARFEGWENDFDGKLYLVGEEYDVLSGCDVTFTPKFKYSYDFSTLSQGYINGYEDGTFRPQNNITRAEACKIIASLIDPEGKSEGQTKFSDVTPEKWYFDYVATLDAIGAFDDIPWGSFVGETPISRAEFVQLVMPFAMVEHKAKSFRT